MKKMGKIVFNVKAVQNFEKSEQENGNIADYVYLSNQSKAIYRAVVREEYISSNDYHFALCIILIKHIYVGDQTKKKKHLLKLWNFNQTLFC